MSPCQALYSLFEEQSSKRFRDEYLGIEMDASRIFWICTANDISVIPSPIRDRVEVISLSMPSNEQCISIAKSIYERACVENPWGVRFNPELDDGSATKLVGGQNNSIRDIQRVIDKCFALTAHYFRHAHSEGCISFSDDIIAQAIKSMSPRDAVLQRIGF